MNAQIHEVMAKAVVEAKRGDCGRVTSLEYHETKGDGFIYKGTYLTDSDTYLNFALISTDNSVDLYWED